MVIGCLEYILAADTENLVSSTLFLGVSQEGVPQFKWQEY